MDHPIREFAPGDLKGARAFMDSLQPNFERVYVDELEDDHHCWRFIFGDTIRHAQENLTRITDGRRFRIRALWPVERRPQL